MATGHNQAHVPARRLCDRPVAASERPWRRFYMTSEQTNDEAAFHDFEHGGWERAAEHYAARSALTVQATDPILDAVRVTPGTRLLDVASGPATSPRAAALRGRPWLASISRGDGGGRARRHPLLVFEEGDAEALSFEAGRFDACHELRTAASGPARRRDP